MAGRFQSVDRYLATRLGASLDIPPGRTAIVESPRRLVRESSYGYIRALWWIWLDDGRSILSVPPSATAGVESIARQVIAPEGILASELAERLKEALAPVLERAGMGPANRTFTDLAFACSSQELRRHDLGRCIRLTDGAISPAPGLRLPTHCFPDGVVYGVVVEGQVASYAFRHTTGLMEDEVADVAVETAAGFRGHGYAKTAVSALVNHYTQHGGQAWYVCDPQNAASIATARSVGFVPYATSLLLTAPATVR
jgi:ribosomal protein S18 acetylase RimI-like enzyme